MVTIRPYREEDWEVMWQFMKPVFRAGETYPYPPEIISQEAHHQWIEKPGATFVAVDERDRVVGTYYIKQNMPGLGAHVCNCGYIVDENNQGRGIGSMMCEHSQHAARDRGFRAMQYNLVVATNQGAVHLWQKHGFRIVGTLPRAFHHQRLGYVDAHIMYKELAG